MSPISEDELRARLEDVQLSPARHGFAERVVQQGRGRRRRQRWVMAVAAAAAVAVIGGGALAIGDQIGREEALPASPTPTPTQPEVTPTVTGTSSPSSTATASGTPTVSPTATPMASASATSVPSSTPTRPTAPELTPTPLPVLTPTSPPAIEPAWETLNPVTLLHARSWTPTNAFAGPCGREISGIAGLRHAYLDDQRRNDSGEGQANGEAYVLFVDEDGAAAFMDDLRNQSRRCTSTTDGAIGGVVEGLSGPWSDGLALSYFSSQPPVSGGSVVLAVRSGRAVTLSSASGSFTRTDRVDPGLIRAARPSVEHVYPQLCGFTDEGC
ncbi:hypothetical protein V6K52_09685 [Knoellia sp. S7-12]|uniref:hypothetical protein n=1 Tax=Knoellia sp. S7-12 TaxID=3126698 RepID=UPI003367E9AB